MRLALIAALGCALAASGGCAHATKTRAQERAESAAPGEAPAKAPPPQRAETMETSATTQAMFKPDGIRKLQAALDEAVRDIDQEPPKKRSPPELRRGKAGDDEAGRDEPRDDAQRREEEEQAERTGARGGRITFVKETGRFDARTQLALQLYQKAEGLPETGLPDYETLRRLGLDPREILYHDVPAERLGVP